MYLFIHEGIYGDSEAPVKKAFVWYANEVGLAHEGEINISRTETGKPFFDNVPGVHFSVSHSGALWVCAMGNQNVGVDIQQVKTAKTDEIADRYFTDEEKHYVDLWGDYGFFDLWVRKEALVKYLGSTLAESIGMEVARDGDLLERVHVAREKHTFDEQDVFDGQHAVDDENDDSNKIEVAFIPIDMGDDIKCVIAAGRIENVEIRILN